MKLYTIYGELIIDQEFSTIKIAIKYAIDNKKSLSGADLIGANLTGADLSKANLTGADLTGADLTRTNLIGANLTGADLTEANLTGANLTGANLRKADLSKAKNMEYSISITRIIPDGDVIGWKKCRDGALVKLLIPADAKRNNAFGRKCRASKAKVLEIIGAETAVSNYDSSFIYRAGETVEVANFDEDFTNECSTGIHFFITRLEAEKY